MRAYFFANSWLSGIQKGLQSAHVVAEMASSLTAADIDLESSDFLDWMRDHKTIVILDGGSHNDLRTLAAVFNDKDNPFVWDCFSEDEESLNGAMTCVGIILPERIYETAKILREGPPYDSDKFAGGFWTEDFTEWEAELIKLLNSCPLAR